MELPVQRKNQKKYTRHNDSKPDKNQKNRFLVKTEAFGLSVNHPHFFSAVERGLYSTSTMAALSVALIRLNGKRSGKSISFTESTDIPK